MDSESMGYLMIRMSEFMHELGVGEKTVFDFWHDTLEDLYPDAEESVDLLCSKLMRCYEEKE